jgi:16S rRNA (guanine966-N2)-methyltransferase
MFDILTSMDLVEGSAVADLFAGSGALGIEALSRGAASATFVDTDRAAVESIRSNLAVLGEAAGRARVLRADALAWAATPPGPADALDLVFADPPYDWDGWAGLLGVLERRAAVVVAETGRDWDAATDWETIRTRRYGSTVVSVLRPTGESVGAARSTGSAAAQPRGGM